MTNAYMRQVYMGNIGDTKSLEPHFSQMAAQGWMIDKLGVFTHRYRAVKPCKKRFFVDLLPQITAFDYPENEDAQDYRRLCEESGWTFVTANRQFHIFCADEHIPEPTPIHTDNKIQAQIYLRLCRKYELFSLAFPMLVLGFIVTAQVYRLGTDVFLSNLMLFQMLGWMFFLPGYLWMFGAVLLWYMRTKKAAKLGLPMPRVSHRMTRVRGGVFIAGTFAFAACMIAGVVLELLGGLPAGLLLLAVLPLSGVGVGLWIRRQVETRRRTRGANIRLTIIVIVVTEIVLLGAAVFTLMRTSSYTDSHGSLGSRPAQTLESLGAAPPPRASFCPYAGLLPDNGRRLL